MTDTFRVKHVRVVLGGKEILSDIHFSLPEGSVTAVVGPNGAGKTTLIRLLARLQRPAEGKVVYRGNDLFGLSASHVAKTLAILPQIRHVPEGLTVETLAGYGRFPHRGRCASLSRQDRDIVHWALHTTHLEHLRKRPIAHLSGGEQQRAWIAMALAQKPEVLILDEPTTFLDIAYQLEILELLRSLNKKANLTLVMVLHDLNHALRYADRVLLIRDGGLKASGSAQEVLTAETLNSEFCIDADIFRDERNDRPFIVPHIQIHHKEAL